MHACMHAYVYTVYMYVYIEYTCFYEYYNLKLNCVYMHIHSIEEYNI